MYGLAVNLIVSVSGHPWIINEMFYFSINKKQIIISNYKGPNTCRVSTFPSISLYFDIVFLIYVMTYNKTDLVCNKMKVEKLSGATLTFATT
jgi:hypothetical protein